MEISIIIITLVAVGILVAAFGTAWRGIKQAEQNDFRPVRLRASSGVRAAGWAVEKSANGGGRGIVSHLFPTRAEAKAEADRLNALAPKKTEK